MANWRQVPLGDVFDVQLGKMLGAGSDGGDQYQYLANRNVQWGQIVIDELGTMNFSEPERERYRLQHGDLLVCEGGEVGRAALWSDELPECYFQNALHRLRATSAVDSGFMRHYFEFAAKKGKFRGLTGQTSIGHLPRANLVRWLIPVPSMEEQRRIVEVLDTIDETIQASERVIAKLQLQLRGTTNNLLTVGQDWNHGPVGSLLAAIDSGKSPVAEDRLPGPAEWGVLKVSAIHSEGFRPQEVKTVPSALIRKDDEVRHGDVLVTRANTTALVGMCCYVDQPPPRLQLSDKTLRLVSNSRVRPKFLALLLQSPGVRTQIERDGTGSSGSMKNISQQEIRDLIVSWPSKQVQGQILEGVGATENRIRMEVEHFKKLCGLRSGLAADLLSGRVRTVAA